MKKLFNVKSLCAILLCFVMIISLCACTDTEQNSSTHDDVSAPAVNSSVNADNSVDETPSQDATSSNESDDTTTQTPSQNTESSKVESTVTSSTPVTSTTPPTSETTSSSSSSYGEIIIEKWRDDELIIGKWRGEYDLAPMLSEIGFGTIEGTAIVACDIEFTADGKLYKTLDIASAEIAYRNIFTQDFNMSVTNAGVTLEEYEATLGFTREEYVDEMVKFFIKSIPETTTNKYKFEIFTLYTRSEGETEFVNVGHYFTDENTLTLTEEGVTITYTRID